VRDHRKMLAQIKLFQRLALSNFRELMIAVAQDPAMLAFLDAGVNVKGAPNENFAREACAGYRTPVDYGLVTMDLPKVAALIAVNLPTRLYHVAYRNNAFDTHVHQPDQQQRLLTYVSDAVSGCLRDMERIGRADDVVLMAFSEFGRRAPENANLGTDHGTAGPMFLAGKPVRGGQYGELPDLASRTADDNLVHSCDFRRVYATVADGWLGLQDSAAVLRGRFEPWPVFA
jgi:uncharacterized protein (DUF1501 family)